VAPDVAAGDAPWMRRCWRSVRPVSSPGTSWRQGRSAEDPEAHREDEEGHRGAYAVSGPSRQAEAEPTGHCGSRGRHAAVVWARPVPFTVQAHLPPLAAHRCRRPNRRSYLLHRVRLQDYEPSRCPADAAKVPGLVIYGSITFFRSYVLIYLSRIPAGFVGANGLHV
jgi:hypothetical protein